MLRLIVKAMVPPRFSDSRPVNVRDEQFHLIIVNAGTSDAVTLDETVVIRAEVLPDSSARVREDVVKAPTFSSRIDRLRWKAGGGRSLPDMALSPHEWVVASGRFSFTPHGSPITFRTARDLPTNQPLLIQALTRSLTGTQAEAPAPALRLRQYGFLLATAPLTHAVRSGLLASVAKMHGLRICTGSLANHAARTEAFCIHGHPTSTEILLDPQRGVVCEIRERLTGPTPLFPRLKTGALVDSDSFFLQQSRRQSSPAEPLRHSRSLRTASACALG